MEDIIKNKSKDKKIRRGMITFNAFSHKLEILA